MVEVGVASPDSSPVDFSVTAHLHNLGSNTNLSQSLDGRNTSFGMSSESSSTYTAILVSVVSNIWWVWSNEVAECILIFLG